VTIPHRRAKVLKYIQAITIPTFLMFLKRFEVRSRGSFDSIAEQSLRSVEFPLLIFINSNKA
jgi:hypothetical protein